MGRCDDGYLYACTFRKNTHADGAAVGGVKEKSRLAWHFLFDVPSGKHLSSNDSRCFDYYRGKKIVMETSSSSQFDICGNSERECFPECYAYAAEKGKSAENLHR